MPLLKSPAARREALFLLALILVVLASRLPFIMHGLDEWDTANFALSVVHFDVLTHQPHPPGQFFYVRLMQFINLFTGNELFTLSFASAVGSTLALIPYYLALRQVFRPAVAQGAAVLTAFTFGFWITSLRMISDPVACLFVYGTVCSLLIGLTDRRWFWLGMALCGVALGVKQTTLYFLAPFAIAVNLVVLFRHGLRRPLLGSVIFAAAVAAWLLPSVSNCQGWANYLTICRAVQHENYVVESIIFHLTPLAAHIQYEQNLLQPWGAVALAALMLTLAAVGLVVCLRRGVRGGLFALFGLSVAFYAFFFLYRFNKYYVYYVPFYCALAAAALFAIGEFLARRTNRPLLRDALPWLGVALITAVNVGLTAPLLPPIAHFRAPPQNALENLRRMPGVDQPPILLTDDITTNRELRYFYLKKKVDLLNYHTNGLQDAVAALNAGRKVYFLSPLTFGTATAHPDAIHLLGQYVWRHDLFQPLQGRFDLRQLFLYELAAPLPVEYTFPDAVSRPPMLVEGMWGDGWCSADTRFLLPTDEKGPDLAHLGFTLEKKFDYHYPYHLTCQFADGSHRDLTVEHPGRADFVVPLPNHPGGQVVEMELLAPQTTRPMLHDPQATDGRDLSVLLNEVDCVTPARPLLIHREAGWYDPETDGAHHWRWTDGNAALSVLAERAATLVLEGDVISFSGGNAVEVLIDDRPAAVLELPGTAWAHASWHLPVEAGLHRVVLHSRNPGAQLPNDGRRLALRVQDLGFRLEP